MKKLSLRLGIGLFYTLPFSAAENPRGSYLDAYRSFRGPLVFKDKATQVLFYVESDGRHVAAIDLAGKLLWNCDPFVEGKLKPYRIDEPKIIFIGEPHDWMIKNREGHFVALSFNSSQFGILNIATGKFIFLGQD